jgi:hypothetical protein
MKEALIYGSALASFCVEKFGWEKLLELSDAAVAERVQEFVTLTKFEV